MKIPTMKPEQAVAFLAELRPGPWILVAIDIADGKAVPAQTFQGDDEGSLLDFLYLYHGTHTISIEQDHEQSAIRAMEAEAAGGGPRTARREAEEFLGSKLALGPVPVDELLEEAEANGISERTLKRAKQALKVKAWKEKNRTHGRWHWELPKTQEQRGA